MAFPIHAQSENVEESRRAEETGMRRVIDGVYKSQTMMGDESRGMCKSVVGECNEVRQKRCIQRRSKRYRERGMETEGTARREWKTRDCKTDSA